MKPADWLVLLEHSSCCQDPGRCARGNTCVLGVALATHLQMCSDQGCRQPMCQEAKILLRHWGACRQDHCGICCSLVAKHRRAAASLAFITVLSSAENGTRTCRAGRAARARC